MLCARVRDIRRNLVTDRGLGLCGHVCLPPATLAVYLRVCMFVVGKLASWEVLSIRAALAGSLTAVQSQICCSFLWLGGVRSQVAQDVSRYVLVGVVVLLRGQ